MPKAATVSAAPANRHARRAAAAGKPSPFAMAFSLEAPAENDEEKKSRRAADRAKKDGESDEDYATRCAELDEKEKAEDDKEKKEAETDDTNPDASASDEEKCEAARAEGFAAGGQRWQDVLTAKEAKGKGLIACHLLATTTMNAPDICSALTAMAPDGAGETGLARRMSAERVEPPKPATAAAPAGADGMITPAAIIAAAAAVRGDAPATR